MQRVVKKTNRHKYTFVNESVNSSTGFAHKTTLLQDGHEISSARINYYNRTWEPYRFRTAMVKAVEKLAASELKFAIDAYKLRTGRKRISKDEKENVIISSAVLRELDALHGML